MAIMFVTCSVAMLAAQSMLLFPAVRRRIDQRWVAATFAASALVLSFTAVVSDAGALGLLIAVVGTGVGLIGPVLSYELLERDRSEAGGRLGKQAAAGNLGQALGSFSAGWLFALHPAAPFGLAALVFHHLSWQQKQRTAREIYRVLRPGGELHVADWGRASGPLMRGAFLAIQLLDGFANTRNNVEGRLVELFQTSGFGEVSQPQSFSTVFGTLALYRAVRLSTRQRMPAGAGALPERHQ
jgi:SAM-dependent methyltransferase